MIAKYEQRLIVVDWLSVHDSLMLGGRFVICDGYNSLLNVERLIMTI